MTGESRQDEEHHNCPRCDGYVCAEHREPSYERLTQRLAAAEALLREACEVWKETHMYSHETSLKLIPVSTT
jgi:transcription initiation factor IIE alpha subunit